MTKESRRTYSLNWRNGNRDKVNASALKYIRSDKGKASRARYYASDKGKAARKRFSKSLKFKMSQAKTHLKRFYNLTWDQFEEMRKLQNDRCALCDRKFTRTPRVDHDHKTDKVRGLLCHHCNSGLGLLQDDPELLRKAIKYLCK